MAQGQRYRKVYCRMWSDEKFRRLSPSQPCGQFLFFWLLTNRKTTIIPGLFECGEIEMADILNWELEAFREAFREALNEGLVKVSWKDRLVWVPNAIRYNTPTSPNVIKSWAVTWDELPGCELKDVAYRELKAFTEGLSKGFREAFVKACGTPSGTPCANKDKRLKTKDIESSGEKFSQKKDVDTLSNIGDLQSIVAQEHWGISLSQKLIGEAYAVLKKHGSFNAEEVKSALETTKNEAGKPNGLYLLSVLAGNRKKKTPAKRDPNVGPHPGHDWTEEIEAAEAGKVFEMEDFIDE